MQQKPKSKLLKQAEIRREIPLQTRAGINMSTVEEYKEALQGGATFPRVVTFFDGVYYYLADGWHRYEAYVAARIDEIPSDVYEGSRRDAQLYALGANAVHGLRRTNEDKRRAVALMLDDEEWSHWSDHEIARSCKVSQPFVGKVRATLTDNVISHDEPDNVIGKEAAAESLRASVEGDRPRTYTTKHGTDAVMKTAKIGRVDAPIETDGRGDASRDSANEDDQAELDAYVSRLERDNEALRLENDSLRASDRGAEIQKLTQRLINAENKLSEAAQGAQVREKSLRWFGRKFAELRTILGVQHDRDVVSRVRALTEAGQ
ncbi:ParB N-terminal domain-containing protein [Burkholderia semiarida]|uniref:hypothetical protein n=1 Tax=Burkholderia semiarida TaxID=2843303 RepID=UPI0023DD8C87|nr:hypothetical protein [Burkholderia semiarida]MDF3116316.1 ParB N-terminal domain-containing protein [Burkholderia semiarida]